MIILDAGHGGFIDGKYTTAPNKMYKHPRPIFGNQTTAFEGEINRNIMTFVETELLNRGMEYSYAMSMRDDTPLKDRVNKANEMHKLMSCFYLSIHSNAGGGHGNEVFVSNNASDTSKQVAGNIAYAFEHKIDMPLRRHDPNIPYKTANFYVLRKTTMPAVLVECGFFDDYEDAKKLYSVEYQRLFASAIVTGLVLAGIR